MLCFEKVSIIPKVRLGRARDLLVEYVSANDKGKDSVRRNSKWSHPLAGIVKINVDVVVDIHAERVSLGLVARDSNGKVLMAASKSVWPFMRVEHAETDGFWWAVQLASSNDWKRCVFEGDAKMVIEALNGNIIRVAHIQVIIENILATSLIFDQVSFEFYFREANMVAHRLARWSATSFCNGVWSVGGRLAFRILLLEIRCLWLSLPCNSKKKARGRSRRRSNHIRR